MRRIICGLFLSLDGVMQAPGGPTEDPTGGFALGGWSTSYWDAAMGDRMGAFMGGDFDLLLGRKTYEIFAAHWPYSGDAMGAKFDAIAKYVVSNSGIVPTWQNSHVIDGDIAAGIARLKATDGPDLIVQGSSKLYPLLMDNGLIDSLFVMTFPVILGHGKRPFANAPSGALTLIDQALSSTGVVMATYQPAGAVPIGSFQLETPSDAEVARQAKMRIEG